MNGLAGFFDGLKPEKKVMSGHRWRAAGEVVEYLRRRGAAIPSAGHGPEVDEWAASSDGE